jgi:hypothetical protein
VINITAGRGRGGRGHLLAEMLDEMRFSRREFGASVWSDLLYRYQVLILQPVDVLRLVSARLETVGRAAA